LIGYTWIKQPISRDHLPSLQSEYPLICTLIFLTFSNRTEQILEDGGDSIAPPPRRRVSASLLPAKPVLASMSCAHRADQPVAESAAESPSVDESGVAESAQSGVAEPAVAKSAKSAIAKPTVAESAVAESVDEKAAVDQSAVDKSIVDQSSIDQSVIDQSGIDKSVVDKSGVDKSGIDKSGVDKSSDQDSHFSSPAPAPCTPSPQPLQGASRMEGGIFRGHATGNAENMADLDEQPAEHHPGDRKGKVLFFTSRDPDAWPYLSMKHSVTPSLHSILSDLGNEYSPV
jgi:hypothetical protein